MPTLDADLDAIFADDLFGTCAEITIAAGELICVRGFFTDASDSVLMFGNVEIEALKPTFVCKTADITSVRNKMAVTIGDTAYTVEKIVKIGTGSSVMYLKT